MSASGEWEGNIQNAQLPQPRIADVYAAGGLRGAVGAMVDRARNAPPLQNFTPTPTAYADNANGSANLPYEPGFGPPTAVAPPPSVGLATRPQSPNAAQPQGTGLTRPTTGTQERTLPGGAQVSVAPPTIGLAAPASPLVPPIGVDRTFRDEDGNITGQAPSTPAYVGQRYVGPASATNVAPREELGGLKFRRVDEVRNDAGELTGHNLGPQIGTNDLSGAEARQQLGLGSGILTGGATESAEGRASRLQRAGMITRQREGGFGRPEDVKVAKALKFARDQKAAGVGPEAVAQAGLQFKADEAQKDRASAEKIAGIEAVGRGRTKRPTVLRESHVENGEVVSTERVYDPNADQTEAGAFDEAMADDLELTKLNDELVKNEKEIDKGDLHRGVMNYKKRRDYASDKQKLYDKRKAVVMNEVIQKMAPNMSEANRASVMRAIEKVQATGTQVTSIMLQDLIQRYQQ